MERLYEGMFRENLAPAAALRQAQIFLRGKARESDPSRWAGFELQGDWR
jgi:CHAT domain-containing protein